MPGVILPTPMAPSHTVLLTTTRLVFRRMGEGERLMEIPAIEITSVVPHPVATVSVLPA